MNTHRAVIETSVPPSLLLVGAGDKESCKIWLDVWIQRHPLNKWQRGHVLEVMDTVQPREDALEPEPDIPQEATS